MNPPMLRAVAAAVAIMLTGALPNAASAQQTASCQGTTVAVGPNAVPMCSKDFYVSGLCTNGDVTGTFSDPNAVSGSGWAGVGPWEASPISIVGASIAFLSQGGLQYSFIGNSYSPDIMLWYDRAATPGATSKMWAPHAFAFPPQGTGGQPHIDLHVGCTQGAWQAFVTIDYTVP